DPLLVTRSADRFSALGAEPRLRILRLLLAAHPTGMVVGEVQEELGIPASTLSHHLEKLKQVGLVHVRRESTYLWYSADTDALRAASGGTACCGGGAERSGCDPISKDLYTNAEKGALPEKALAASLGCGNPTALAQLQPGETVLDLGSGGGIDVILSAKRVGPTGKA